MALGVKRNLKLGRLMMMLFFQRWIKLKTNWPLYGIAPLQVRICKIIYNFFIERLNNLKEHLGKRALSWAFRSTGSRELRASLTLEAALCLPLFLFFGFCLLMPMRIMDRQRQLQAVVESVGEDISRYAYVVYSMEGNGKNRLDTGKAGTDSGENRDTNEDRSPGSEAVQMLSEAYAAAAILSKIDSSWVENVSFRGTDIGTNEMVHIVMSCRMRLPFSVLRLDSIPMEIVCNRRMWTGADGNRQSSDLRAKDEEEQLVYIGKASTRYHLSRTCHYLYNDLQSVSAEVLDTLRNKEGKRYQPCSVCAAGVKEGTVYVMPYGTSYHKSPGCSSIIAYVQQVPLPQAEHLGACSYCGSSAAE